MKKKGGQRGRDFMLGFVEEIILNWDLNDLKPKSGRFTWSNHRAGAAKISAILDRFLVSSSLIDGKSLVSTKILPKLTSYHHPISLLIEREEEWGQFLLDIALSRPIEWGSLKWFPKPGLST